MQIIRKEGYNRLRKMCCHLHKDRHSKRIKKKFMLKLNKKHN